MTCRVCGGPLETILDFGEQCLGGQFVKIGEPDPPRFPLVLSRCHLGCGLVQLRDAVDPELMYRNYWYRSGVTLSMKEHLADLAGEAVRMHAKKPKRILDIGSNDGTLQRAAMMHVNWGTITTAIDPSDVPSPHNRIRGFFPQDMPSGAGPFDLIFTIACFYDTTDPVGFAKAVRDNLAPGGLWCVEVADLRAMYNGAWDGCCHEHLSYFSAYTLDYVVRKAGMHTHKISYNQCNGGSIRLYAGLEPPSLPETLPYPFPLPYPLAFPEVVRTCRDRLRGYIDDCFNRRDCVHLLGASTKMNTVLQYCDIDDWEIVAASDRDPRKHGCCTPGTGIPIISEEESRAMKPDVYLVGPWSFREELIEREKAFLNGGGRLVFPLPLLEEIHR